MQANASLSAFGSDRSRPPLFLQGRCKACLKSMKAQRDAAKREATRALKAIQDLDSIAREVNAITSSRTTPVALYRADGFNTYPLSILEIPRARGRWPAKRNADAYTFAGNWNDLIDSQAREWYRSAGGVAYWLSDRTAPQVRDQGGYWQRPIPPEQWAEWFSPAPGDSRTLQEILRSQAKDGEPCDCEFCVGTRALNLCNRKTALISELL